MDKSHRITGVLLVLVILQTLMVVYLVKHNAFMDKLLARAEQTYPIYVVPGALPDVYRPDTRSILATSFTDFLTQSLYTFTYESYPRQYEEVKRFFSPQFLRYADNNYQKRIAQARTLKASEVFVMDRQSLKAEEWREPDAKGLVVTVNGTIQRVVNGSLVEAAPVSMKIRLKSVLVSKANPFGFTVMSLNSNEIVR